MTSNDFRDWYAYHSKAFPGVADWIRKHPDTLQFWELPFAGVDLADAKQATKEMATGDLEEPRGFGQHAKTIAKRAREIGFNRQDKTQAVDGQQVYSCATCFDEGLVAVVDPRYWRDGTYRACSTYCTCQSGDRKQNRKFLDGHKAIQRPRFDKQKMFRIDYELLAEESRAQFVAWMAERSKVENHPNYTDFGDYSHEQQETF